MASEDDRLKAVIAREKARKAREAEEAAAAETREREKAELKRSAQQRWPRCSRNFGRSSRL